MYHNAIFMIYPLFIGVSFLLLCVYLTDILLKRYLFFLKNFFIKSAHSSSSTPLFTTHLG